jgi:hypothetical protein
MAVLDYICGKRDGKQEIHTDFLLGNTMVVVYLTTLYQ